MIVQKMFGHGVAGEIATQASRYGEPGMESEIGMTRADVAAAVARAEEGMRLVGERSPLYPELRSLSVRLRERWNAMTDADTVMVTGEKRL